MKYRKKVVLDNLKLAFPEKTDAEREKIAKDFYRHFCDLFIESLKFLTISERALNKRYIFKDIDVFNNIYPKDIIITCGHYANWEWMTSIPPNLPEYKCVAVYMPLTNKYFNKAIAKSRGRFGVKLVIPKDIYPEIEENKKSKTPSVYGLASDQSPTKRKAKYWTEFMGIKVPTHVGTELLAKQHDCAVIFLKSKKVKRGYYEITPEVLSESPIKTTQYELTDLFLRKLEQQIKEDPQYYFWTHRRWKHRVK